MRVRWLCEMNKVTADDILNAREKGVGFSLMGIKTILEDKTAVRLQFFDLDVFGQQKQQYGAWVDVPLEVEYREGPLPFEKIGL